MLEAKQNKGLTMEEEEERKQAREAGRQMAKDTIKKLKPQWDGIAKIISEACDRCTAKTCEMTLKEVGEWLENTITGEIPERLDEPFPVKVTGLDIIRLRDSGQLPRKVAESRGRAEVSSPAP